MVGTTRGARVQGHVEDGWGKVADAFRANFEGNPGEVGAACCVYVDGRPVVDLRGGLADREANRPWGEDTVAAVTRRMPNWPLPSRDTGCPLRHGVCAPRSAPPHTSVLLRHRWLDVRSDVVDPGWVSTRMGGPGAPDDLDPGHATQEWLAASSEPNTAGSGGYWYHRQRPAGTLPSTLAKSQRRWPGRTDRRRT